MISIKKRIMTKQIITTLSVLVSVVVVIFVICILPCGVYKTSVARLNIAEDVDVYIATKKIDRDILNAINSLYQNQILNDKLVHNFNTMQQSISNFSNILFKGNIGENILLPFVSSRGAAFMIWGRTEQNNILSTRQYLLFDIGFALEFVFDKIIYDNHVGMFMNMFEHYRILKTVYQDVNIYSVVEKNNQNSYNNQMYFIIHKGKLIYTDKLDNTKKMAEHLSANISSIKNIPHINKAKTKAFADISLYMTYWAYHKIFNSDVEMLHGEKFSSVCGNIKFDSKRISVNMNLINENNAKTLYNTLNPITR